MPVMNCWGYTVAPAAAGRGGGRAEAGGELGRTGVGLGRLLRARVVE